MNEPRQLWSADVSQLHLENHPKIDAAEAATLLLRSPGASFWIPNTCEFILVTPWRHRSELVTVHTFGAFGNEDALLRAVLDHAATAGYAGLVVVDINETRKPGFYLRHGLQRFEDIVTYEHRRPARLASGSLPQDLEFIRVDGSDKVLLRAILELDHAAFSWFWWNSPEEFDAYLDIPGVEVWAGIRDNDVVAYAGTTVYRRWAHLDRIAIRPDLQGLGIGKATLTIAVRKMVRHGGRRIALSTQGDNHRSRRLYRRTGFERTPQDDYSVFVAPFDDPRVFAGLVGQPHQARNPGVGS